MRRIRNSSPRNSELLKSGYDHMRSADPRSTEQWRRRQRRSARTSSRGIAHVKRQRTTTRSSPITDINGETICWDSAGTIGFKGARKSTPFAATRAGESAGQKARKVGMSEVEVFVKGTGAGRESAVTGLVSTGIRVTAVEDHTPIPHNGCRPTQASARLIDPLHAVV